MDICKHFVTNLKYYRVKAGMSQTDYAKKIDTTQQCISFWETGEKIPHLQELPRIAGGLGITVTALLGLEHEQL